MPEAIFFDLDDTLVDDTGCYQLSIEGVCADLGPPFDPSALRAAYDATSLPWWPGGDIMSVREKLWAQALGACGYDASLTSRVVERYLHHRVHTAKLLDGVLDVLEGLRSEYRLAVITNGSGDIQRLRVAHLGLDRYFDLTIASTDANAGKPDARIFDYALSRLDLSPDETGHVGDSLASDVAGALNAGLQAAVWYKCDGAECRPEDAQPHYQITALTELPALIKKWG